MANGRLGKANVLAKGTTAVYTNSSGAEASVSVVAQATGGSQFHLRIDSSSSNLETTTTIVSETYNERFLRYNITNSLLTDPTSAYAGRFQYFDTTTSSSNNIDTQFEAYVASNTTTYSCKTDTGEMYNTQSIYPYETWKSLQSSVAYGVFIGPAARNRIYWYDLSTRVTDQASYYERILGTVVDFDSQDVGLSYSNCGICFDPWEREFPYCIGIANNTYMTGVSFDVANPSVQYGTNNQTSGSWPRDNITTTLSVPNGTNNYPNMRLNNRVTVIDPCALESRFGINVLGPRAFDSSLTASNRAEALLSDNYRHEFKIDQTSGATRAGGQVLFMEYNPVDKLHYICYFKADTQVYYLATIDRAVAITQGAPNNFTSTITSGGSDSAKGFNDITSQLSLTIASPYEFSISTDNTSRSSFIGTAASPLWALCFSRLANDNTASDTYYSTDLKTWKSSAAFYTPADYSAVVGDSTVKSNSGTVTATRSNIVNLGADGVLEYATDFSQYSQSGLVLSNGDRVLTYISGENPVSIQVMGFEGG